LAAAGQAALFSSGIAALLAFRAGDYAVSLVCAGVAIWIATEVVSQLDRRGASVPLPPTPPEVLELQRDRMMLRAYLDQVPAPILSLAHDGVLRTVNRAARRLFAVDDRIPEASETAAAIADCAPGERRVLHLAARGGRPRAFSLTTADAAGAGGAVRLAALVDVESEVQAAEAQALRELLQVLSHELMNSLTPVASLAETAEGLLRDGETAQALDALETLARRAGGLGRFVESYRTLARLPPPSPRDTDVSSLVEDVARLFSTRWRAEAVELRLELPRAAVRARLDPDLVSQALTNLLANAAEAALEGPLRPAWVRLSASGGDEGLEIRVSDSGRGLGEADCDEIFRPFFTTKASGTGVGLSLARQIARSHGGELAAEPTRPGTGAEFRLCIP
jgi:signal transduction histidine kinase